MHEYRPTNAVQEQQYHKMQLLNKNSHVVADNENRKLQIKIQEKKIDDYLNGIGY